MANALASLRTAKSRGPFTFVLQPYHWLDVWTELGKPAATYPNMADLTTQALRDYFVTVLLSCRVFQHAMITVDTNGDAISAVFSPPALGLDTRKPPTLEPERDASKRAWELNMSAGYDTGVLRNAFGCKLVADATSP
jgi:hypothetical protein